MLKRSAVVPPLELVLWVLVLLAALYVQTSALSGPNLHNDSYKYLDVAKEIREGHGLATSVIEYDVEHRSGALPAPLTTFPPLYAIALAAVAAIGVSPEWAGVLVSEVSLVGVLILVGLLARLWRFGPWMTRAVLLSVALNSVLVNFGTAVLSESLFTLFVVGCVACYARAATAEEARLRWVAAASVVAGLAVATRYAGLFIVLALGLTEMRRLVVTRAGWKSAMASLLSLSPAAVVVVLIAVRNLALAGTPMGGNDKAVRNAIGGIVIETGRAARALFLGHDAGRGLRPLELAALGCLAVLAVVLLLGRRGAAAVPAGARPGRDFMIITSVLYTIGIVYAAITTVVSYDTRFYAPIWPLILLLAVDSVGRELGRERPAPMRRALLAVAAFALVAAGVTNVASLTRGHPIRHQSVAARLAATGAEGTSPLAWIADHVPPAQALVATDAQATSYITGRPVVSLIESEYSVYKWSDDVVHDTMRRYGARALVLYPGTADPTQRESAFLGDLLTRRGAGVPWLHLVVSAPEAWIFERLD